MDVMYVRGGKPFQRCGREVNAEPYPKCTLDGIFRGFLLWDYQKLKVTMQYLL